LGPKNWPLCKGLSEKWQWQVRYRFSLVIDASGWPLLTGGPCSEVVVKPGLAVLDFNHSN